MDFKYEIYNVENDELLITRDNENDKDVSHFNLEISMLTNVSKGDHIKLSNSDKNQSYDVVIVKKSVEFKTSGDEAITMILRIWVEDDNASDLTEIPEWWKGIEFTQV